MQEHTRTSTRATLVLGQTRNNSDEQLTTPPLTTPRNNRRTTDDTSSNTSTDDTSSNTSCARTHRPDLKIFTSRHSAAPRAAADARRQTRDGRRETAPVVVRPH